MTPPKSTAAGRVAADRMQPSPPEQSHPRRLRRSTSPTSPRRVSGPLSGGAAAARPAVAPPAPERARPDDRPRPAVAPVREDLASLRSGLVGFLISLPDRRIIDRLVRGRAWIPVLGVMLAGIVAMQVEVLKLNASTGRAIQQATSLSAVHEQLLAETSAAGDDHHIEAEAARRGMVMAAPGAVGFLSTAHVSAAKAAAAIRSPDSAGFVAASSHNGQVATTPTPPPTMTTTTTSGSTTAAPTSAATGSTSTSTSGSAATSAQAPSTTTATSSPGASTAVAPANTGTSSPNTAAGQ
jgi:hypothetical protein